MIKVSPSILSADFLDLGNEVKNVEKAGADFLHVDIMDGHFVPNLTFGPFIISQLKKIVSIPIEAHLMISNAQQATEEYIKAGATTIIVHCEACQHLDRMVEYIKMSGCSVGVALNPATDESALNYIIDSIDLILVMTVNPGFGGQKFLLSQVKKIQNIKEIVVRKGLKTKIEVDGGINDSTAKIVAKAGADILVAGSYIFGSDNYKKKIADLKNV